MSSFGCTPPGCHRACAVGCIRANDITACTTRYYGGRYRGCTRCTDGYRSLNNPQYLGCTPGAKTDKSCVSPSPAPGPCVDPTEPPVCPQRRLEEDADQGGDSNSTLSGGSDRRNSIIFCRRLEELRAGAGTGPGGRELPYDIHAKCSCDGGASVFVDFGSECVLVDFGGLPVCMYPGCDSAVLGHLQPLWLRTMYGFYRRAGHSARPVRTLPATVVSTPFAPVSVICAARQPRWRQRR